MRKSVVKTVVAVCCVLIVLCGILVGTMMMKTDSIKEKAEKNSVNYSVKYSENAAIIESQRAEMTKKSGVIESYKAQQAEIRNEMSTLQSIINKYTTTKKPNTTKSTAKAGKTTKK